MSTNILERTDFTIIVGVKEYELAQPVVESLYPLKANVVIGSGYSSFSQLVNNNILKCPTEIFIFCSHRVRPTVNDIKTLLERIDNGYGLATLYRLACFGFKKELIRRIGFFDERYVIGGWEDNDFYMRLQEANISYYEDESIEYHAGKSLWAHPFGKPKESEVFFYKKWNIDRNLKTIVRNIEEIPLYDIGESDRNIVFKDWNNSHLTKFSEWQNTFRIINSDKYVKNKKILIFGGTGSLGKKLVEIYGKNNDISIFSRDENKHWNMSLHYQNLKFIIGDIREPKSVKNAIIGVQPNIIIIASALKHIDRCEYEVEQAYMTNCLGTINVLDTVRDYHKTLDFLQTVVFISTDKACSPINTYGLTKALAEKAVVEMSYKLQSVTPIKFVSVRYGNVLNSRGSIIEALDNIGKSILPEYKLNHDDMTRFIMTQQESVALINYAIQDAESGDIVVPKLKSMNIKDMIELYALKYNKSVVPGKMRPGEKIHEDLLNELEMRRTVDTPFYYLVKPHYKSHNNDTVFKYSSDVDTISKEQLFLYLSVLELI